MCQHRTGSPLRASQKEKPQDEATDMNIWKLPMGGQPMLWGRIYYEDPMNKPLENPGDDGDLLAYDSRDVI